VVDDVGVIAGTAGKVVGDIIYNVGQG